MKLGIGPQKIFHGFAAGIPNSRFSYLPFFRTVFFPPFKNVLPLRFSHDRCWFRLWSIALGGDCRCLVPSVEAYEQLQKALGDMMNPGMGERALASRGSQFECSVWFPLAFCIVPCCGVKGDLHYRLTGKFSIDWLVGHYQSLLKIVGPR